ncbi:MAG: hypothetical protein ACRDRO_16305 [Pseudonocardiaceae bacterium]
MAAGTAGVVTGAAAVTGGADTGALGTTGRARGTAVVGGTVIRPLLDRAGEPPTRKYTTVAATNPATTTASADIPMICLDPDRLTGAWITSGPRPSQTLCWSAPNASAMVARPESDTP